MYQKFPEKCLKEEIKHFYLFFCIQIDCSYITKVSFKQASFDSLQFCDTFIY